MGKFGLVHSTVRFRLGMGLSIVVILEKLEFILGGVIVGSFELRGANLAI